jgi:hypothetical protein
MASAATAHHFCCEFFPVLVQKSKCAAATVLFLFCVVLAGVAIIS